MRALRTPLLLASLLALALPAIAGGAPSLDDVLAEIAAKGRAVEDFRARFRQEKSIYLLDEPLRSSGEILYRRAGGKLLWRTERPEPSTLLIDGGGMRVHLPKLRELEVYEFSGKDALGAILPLFGQSVDDLRRSYDVALAPSETALHVLALAPKNERLRRAIAKLEVAVDRASLLPRRLVVVDPNGDRSTTTFDDVRPNLGLTDADFELAVPPGTTVKRPLGGLPF